jgi:hypothetical protein
MKLTRTTETRDEITIPASLPHAYQIVLRAFNSVGSVGSASERSGMIKGWIGSGVANMNPAHVVVELSPNRDSQSRVVFHATAEEGLIFQNTAENAIARVRAAMGGRSSNKGFASIIWIIIAAVGVYWYFYLRDDVKVVSMMDYYASHANTSSLRSEDAERLARACLKYDKNPEYRYRCIIAYVNQYGSIVGSAFHSYNPASNALGDSANIWRLATLVVQQGDYENASFLKTVAAARGTPSEPSNDSGNAQQSKPPAFDKATPKPPAFDKATLKKGSLIIITSRAKLYFHDSFYRYAEQGEKLEIIEYRSDRKRLYVLSKDQQGKPIALNLPDSEHL